MSDHISDFWDAFDAVSREVRAEFIANEKVLALRPDLTARQRWEMALDALEKACAQLEMVSDAIKPTRADIERIDRIEGQLVMLRMKLKMRRSMVHLASEMGRPT